MKNNMFMGVEYQDCFDIDECMATADRFKETIKADRAYICLSDINEQGFDDVENDSSFTEQMILRRELLPKAFFDETETNIFFFFTIHYKNKVHGYMVTEMPKQEWFDIFTHAYTISLASAIENCNVHRRMEMLEEIRALY